MKKIMKNNFIFRTEHHEEKNIFVKKIFLKNRKK